MKKLIFTLIAATGLLASCTVVQFKEPMPKKGKEYTKFPKKMIGKYLGSERKDTLIIAENYFNLENKVINLNSSGKKAILKKYKGYYILNLKGDLDDKENKNWLIAAFKYEKGSINVYSIFISVSYLML